MSAKALMFMGTGSDVGKSLIVAGLCRAFANRGLKIFPFKPQNMSNNAAVTTDGGEIGRAQALQARAAGVEPIAAMNPVLLKPEHQRISQVIVRGKRVGSMPAKQYFATREKYLPTILSSFDELVQQADLVLVEGAGSASEINLRHNDIANFGFARAADVPVVVIGDIQRGGVIASLVGTFAVIDEVDAALIKATLINRFQGDPKLFADGIKQIASLTKRPCLGPITYFEDAGLLPAEDILGLVGSSEQAQNPQVKIAIPLLPRIANFDDFDPLKSHLGVQLQFVAPGTPIGTDLDLIILPGSKTTRDDLDFLHNQGWDIDIKSHIRQGGKLLGICAGFQMLGNFIADPLGIEGIAGTSRGLGLLDVKTTLTKRKQLRLENASDIKFGAPLMGYHMHLGQTEGPDCKNPFSRIDQGFEGATSADGQVFGTYLHGVFASDDFREKFINDLAGKKLAGFNYQRQIEDTLNGLAAQLEEQLDLDALLQLAKIPQPQKSGKAK